MRIVRSKYNRNVRTALKLAINREELVEKILRGYGTVGNDHPVAKSMPFFDPAIEQRAYDPEKAKFHLKQAGLSSLDVQLFTSEAAFEGGRCFAALCRAGEEGRHQHRGRPSAQRRLLVQCVAREAVLHSYWGGRPTPDWMFTAGYSKDAEWNDTKWQNERFNTLLLEARAEIDQNKRAEMYSEMQRLCRDDGGALIPMFGQYVFALRDQIQHGELSEQWNLDSLRFVERWWMA